MVEQRLVVVNEEGEIELESLHFGSMYFGEKRTKKITLHNNGPVPSSFVFTPLVDEGDIEDNPAYENKVPVNYYTELAKLDDSVLQATPNEYMMQPFEKVEVTFTFSPSMAEQKHGFTTTESEERKV